MGRIRGRVGASGGVKALEEVRALLLPASDLFARPWGPASSSCSPVGSAGGFLQGLYRAWNSGAIVIKI